MKHIKIIIIVGAIILLVLDNVQASQNSQKKIRRCSEVDFEIFNNQTSPTLEFKDLPPHLFVAREAEVYVQGLDKNGKLYQLKSMQKFVHAESRAVCSTGEEKVNLSIEAPVLIDLSKKRQVRTSVWNFNLMRDTGRMGVWNQVSKLASAQFELSEWIKDSEQKISFTQSEPDQLKMFVSRVRNNRAESVVIYFDVVKE